MNRKPTAKNEKASETCKGCGAQPVPITGPYVLPGTVRISHSFTCPVISDRRNSK